MTHSKMFFLLYKSKIGSSSELHGTSQINNHTAISATSEAMINNIKNDWIFELQASYFSNCVYNNIQSFTE